MANIYNRFVDLLPSSPITGVTITAIDTNNGTSTATTTAGVTVTVNGTGVEVNNRAYIQNDTIIRQAPNVTFTEVTV